MAKQRKRNTKVPKRKRRRNARAITRDPYISRYLQMLRDPCGSDFIHPPYTGTDAGYIVRVTDSFTPVAIGAGLTAGTTYPCTLAMAYTPYNAQFGASNIGYLGTSFAPGGGSTGPYVPAAVGATNWANTLNSNFVTANAAVGRYRAIAACLKWVPTGPYASRSGLVGVSYAPSMTILNGNTADLNAFQSSCQHISPNGSELHEVRWLPAAGDDSWNFPGNGVALVNTGTLVLLLRGVDAVASAATTANFNGFVEATTIYEWIPAQTTGLTLDPRVPVPYTTQGALSTITNLGDFLYGAMTGMGYNGASNAGRNVASSVRTGVKLLTGGVSQSINRSSGFMVNY